MKTLDELLSRFKLIPDPNKNKIKIKEILQKYLKIEIADENIEIKGNKITITLLPALKSVLFTQKEKVLKNIQDTLALNNISIFFK